MTGHSIRTWLRSYFARRTTSQDPRAVSGKPGPIVGARYLNLRETVRYHDEPAFPEREQCA